MDNNDILRRMRYILDFNDDKMIAVFGLAKREVSRSEVCDWLKQEDDEDYLIMTDENLAIFLNGLIIEKRGRREGEQPEHETFLNNNNILQKLKIAMKLRSEDIIEMFNLIGKQLSAHELSAFLRNSKHRKYMPCNDQYLRNFLSGMRIKLKESEE